MVRAAPPIFRKETSKKSNNHRQSTQPCSKLTLVFFWSKHYMSDQALFSDDEHLLRDDAEQSPMIEDLTWKVLIADDEPDVHKVTRMVLHNFSFDGLKLELISAYSGQEAKKIMASRDDIALAMLDVVMEDEHAGLEVARYIREDLKNCYTRLVLRTGQPGQAPENEVIRNYDINDYKDKTELTTTKLNTLLYATLPE
jgi:CheY-like chemotaxis protein